jgi:muramoyltetrapeptide carboxypeptidase
MQKCATSSPGLRKAPASGSAEGRFVPVSEPFAYSGEVHRLPPPAASRRTLVSLAATAAVSAFASGRASALPSFPALPPTTPAPPAAILAARLSPGDVVGLIDPASATWEPIDVDIVEDTLAALGLAAVRGRHLLDRRGSLAGADRDRAADVMAMFTDPRVKAVLPVRGGWGCARILPYLDFEAIRRNPKVLVGYSDLTALLLAVHARTGLVVFHGPNGASEWNATSADWFTRVVLRGEAATFANPRDRGETLAQTEYRTKTIVPGVARGRLLGGNLSVLTALLGSPYLPDFRGAILFLEDVNEAPYRVDRMLTQLALAGVLGAVAGVVWGTCRDCDPDAGFGSLTIPDLLDDHVKPLGVPAWRGALVGHIDRQFTLPIGTEVEIDATAHTIRMLAPAVR